MTPPTSTYRLQLGPDLDFAAATALMPHLARLGVGALYLSPCFAPREGSTHGYDVVDPTRLNPALGDEAAFERLARAAADHCVGLVLDIVPNHQAACGANPWWRDLLRHGAASPRAAAFDVDWHPPWPGADDRLLLPILGTRYADALADGLLTVALGEDDFELRYYAHRAPLDPKTCAALVTAGLDALAAEQGGGDAVVQGLRAVASALDALPPRIADATDRAERARAAMTLLADLRAQSPVVRAHLDANLARLHTADAAGQARLDRLLSAQAWRLAYWKTAVREINYRRFFNINDLAGVRVEDAAVRDASHALVLRLWDAGLLSGLRVDHVDGLHDPHAYLDWLAERTGGRAWITVEKILAPDEDLPPWPVAGTTGYDFLNVLNGLLVEPAGLDALDSVYGAFIGREPDFAGLVRARQRDVIDWLFKSEARRLERDLTLLARRDLPGRDVAASELGRALIGVTAELSVYRTYVRDEPSEAERATLTALVDAAKARDPSSDTAAYDYLLRVLCLDVPPALRDDARAFVHRWQQFTPPVRAKGLEDTSLYVYNRLVSLNDVGAEPGDGDYSLADFHRFNTARAARHPHAMNATTTHDTKRSEDVRARIAVLSELPEVWRATLARWHATNARFRTDDVPHPNEEVLLYQTLLGAWPLADDDVPAFRGERLRTYLVKSAREAKEFTSWRAPDEAREMALVDFAGRILDADENAAFLDDLRGLQARVAFFGMLNGLTQQLLKLAAPGVPDVYQGSERWSLSLVDPDNRRPVDHGRCAELLSELSEEGPDALGGLRDRWRDGAIKLWVTWKALTHRRARPTLYAEGRYVPLYADAKRRNVCAFARVRGKRWVIAAAPRLTTRLTEAGAWPLGEPVWGDAALTLPDDAPDRFTDVLTGQTVTVSGGRLRLADALTALPVALLEATAAGG